MRRLFFALLLVLISPPHLHASDMERRLEAVFLGRFANYIELPDRSRSRFVITLIDDNPFGGMLDQIYKDKTIHGKPIEIRTTTRVREIGKTDILFITLSTTAARQEAIDYAQRNGIVTISEARGFAERGGIIQLNFVGQKTQIKINYAAAQKSGIRIGAPLLSIATVLRGGES
ncbi:YfiR family protein [Trichlorobacter lovleyi]|uniref:YfiR family protein n=1 Tax=Trichlorobacter lovleyi TaxID=313985 RepID=UPI0023F1D89D|nr:YfiR family protein [Trichlorobacter lovleyi]